MVVSNSGTIADVETKEAVVADMSQDVDKTAIASVLDLGSNSVKLVNYHISGSKYKPYYQESVRLRLSDGLEHGVIQEAYIENTIDVLKLFRDIVDFERTNYIIPFATSAIREAKNGVDIVNRIQRETDFDFKILSDRQEAILSYVGAIRALRLPSVLFFDLGGGSLELLLAINYKIKKVISLPLGVLRLTRAFSNDPEYKSVNFDSMISHVNNLLPSKTELGLEPFVHPSSANDAQVGNSSSSHLVLVGVGGVLRSLAKYYQSYKEYPISKLHNYTMTSGSFDVIRKKILPLPPDKIALMRTIGSGRADTVRTGLLVIQSMMKRFGFDDLTVSAHGLREGALATYLQHMGTPRWNAITRGHVSKVIGTEKLQWSESKSVSNLVHVLYSMNLLSDREVRLLSGALSQIDLLWSFRNAENVLHAAMDDDSPFDHKDQVILALALIYVKKKKMVDHEI